MNIPAIILSLIAIARTYDRAKLSRFKNAEEMVLKQRPDMKGRGSYQAWVGIACIQGVFELAIVYFAVKIGL